MKERHKDIPKRAQFLKGIGACSWFEIIKEKNIKIMPTSPEIRSFIKKNKEFKDLLPIGIRL